MGPTASGKTDLAIALAKETRGEIISVDSALVYKDMDIGTAKPSLEERQGVPHWLIDIKTPEQRYSVAEFVKDAIEKVNDILMRGKVPILAGGTMLYFNALINGMSDIPSSDESVRKKVQTLIQQDGLEAVYEELSVVDPDIVKRIHPNDAQRLSRAYEVYLATGKPMSFWQAQKRPGLSYRPMQFCLLPEDRKALHSRIAMRFDGMLRSGLIDEVKFLLRTYQLNPDLPSMRSVGYRQIYAYLDKKDDLETMREKAIAATRQLAKRQFTWLRSWSDAHVLKSGDGGNLRHIVEKIGAT